LAFVGSLFNSSFLITFGDNFYSDGVRSVDSVRFNQTFEEVYTQPSLQTTWYLVAGNHDHYGNVSAQIEYTKKSKRWYYPSYYYTVTKNIPSSSKTVQFVFIDTIILCEDKVNGPAHWQWLDETLNKSKADWLFVAGHYPVYSSAEGGGNKVLIDILKPLLNKYKVHGYFSGHDHGLQHLAENGTFTQYYISGSGSYCTPQYTDPIPQSKFAWPLSVECSNGGFALVTLGEEEMTVTYYSDQKNILYTTTRSRTTSPISHDDDHNLIFIILMIPLAIFGFNIFVVGPILIGLALHSKYKSNQYYTDFGDSTRISPIPLDEEEEEEEL